MLWPFRGVSRQGTEIRLLCAVTLEPDPGHAGGGTGCSRKAPSDSAFSRIYVLILRMISSENRGHFSGSCAGWFAHDSARVGRPSGHAPTLELAGGDP